MKTYIITYYDGGVKTVKAYSIVMAFGMVDGQDFIKEIKEVNV